MVYCSSGVLQQEHSARDWRQLHSLQVTNAHKGLGGGALQTIFSMSGDAAKLDRFERRFAWFKVQHISRQH